VAARPDVSDPSQVEIHDGLFMHIATQMGEVLRRTAQSVNIKERLDFSCALFDAEGGLVANAPHMPVHLGSMGATVKALLRTRRGRMQRGDAWLVNDPANGGTHLPDITVVSPVFTPSGTAPAFFVASRAHHADIGGITPGSMPPFSTRLDQEGAVFEDFELVAGGQLREAALRAALAAGPWPARNAGQNLADLRAQLAANARGAEELLRAAAEHGAARITAAMRAVQDNAADCVEAAIARLGDRSAAFATTLDGGQRIAVRIELDARLRRARIDFSGTSPAGAHNFNAPRAVTLAAVLYVFRTLVERPIPLNEGCLRPLEIVVPAGSLLDPPVGAAVVAGNVETSQMIVDVLYGALGLLAASQGTMNNLTFGDATLQYYETIAGGSGAGPGFPGCDAVQTHMTNSRLTDPEILESRFPVRLREFSIRRGSGGPGLQRGGDGALRRLEFLAPLHGAILANRRSTQAFGLAGGGPGAPGITRILRRDGSVETLPASAGFDLGAGDQLEILTPGGGGHGAPPERPA
jgi:5-oxoprolinase (ATP-hydrolysing)